MLRPALSMVHVLRMVWYLSLPRRALQVLPSSLPRLQLVSRPFLSLILLVLLNMKRCIMPVIPMMVRCLHSRAVATPIGGTRLSRALLSSKTITSVSLAVMISSYTLQTLATIVRTHSIRLATGRNCQLVSLWSTILIRL